MTTPKTEQIRQQAQNMFQESDQDFPFITAEDSELKESGFWNHARDSLMRDTARSQQLSYVEEMAHELGFELKRANPRELAKHEFRVDIKEALKTGIYVSGTSGIGKSDLAMYISDLIMAKGITVLVVDTSQDWIYRSNISNVVMVSTITDFTLTDSTVFDTSQLSVLAQKEFIEKLCTAIWRHQTTVKPRKPIFLWFEEGHIAFPLNAFRSKKYAESVRLVSVGRNIDVRIGVITQFASMVSKDVMKYIKQRYFGWTNEKNDVKYLEGFLGKKEAHGLRKLKAGEFVYSDVNSELTKIAIRPFQSKMRPKMIQQPQVTQQPQEANLLIAYITVGLAIIGLTWLLTTILW